MSTRIRDRSINEPNTPDVKSELSSEYSRRLYTYLGRPIPGDTSILFKLIMLAYTFVMSHVIIALIFQWDNFSTRSKAIENLNLGFLTFFNIIELVFYPEKTELLMKIINGPIYKYTYPLSEKQKELKKDVIIEDKSIRKRFTAILTYYYLVVHLLPCVLSVLKILLTDINNCCGDAYFDFVYSSPIKNVFFYAFVLFLQNVYSVLLCGVYGGWIVLLMCSLLHVGTEIEMLCLFIEELDTRLWSDDNPRDKLVAFKLREEDIINLEKLTENQEKLLKAYLREMVLHHQAIIQAVRNVDECVSSSMFMYNQFCCIELCINLYLGYAITDAGRYTNFTTLLIVATLVGTIGNIGQTLIDKAEKLNKAINECSWINKPKWFQKSMYFMAMSATKPLHIKPRNLYVLNMANTAKIGQAAYSYFNLLRSLKG